MRMIKRYRKGDWKINNNYTPYFARKLIAEDQSYERVFELRELISGRKTRYAEEPNP